MAHKNFIIAIDGFSSCGKSTVAKALAKELNYIFIDSGAMYRAVTLYFLRHAISLDDKPAIVEALANIHIDFIPSTEKTQILLNGEDVSEEIRQMHVSNMVSEVSAIKEVRTAMVAQQQQLGKTKHIVMDGRDIGTTVFPDANLKIFMTASPSVRAERRFAELAAKGESTTMEEVVANLAHRDHIDSTREESPLRQAEDAIVLDNSDLTQEEQLRFVIDEVQKAKLKG
ncbi:(d)CMP kinase [Sphingobacterium psychroaquaticum]|uniref:Cytidylate kinase n=1 Tax=Sphingobacterium psychroaquaticum TaxID=561061 RepID=A0A1X7IJC2_9SPHI|nr:(d)CMP kinase [Sphingobacterium psychroaquaticum]SMG14889.1 cytidylate kinase [Sphingobacterium psychroaquaticum]